MLQLFVAGRDTSAMDVLSNTAGSGVGVACGILFANHLRRMERSLQTIRYHHPGALLLLLCLTMRELVPLFPDYSPYRLWHKILALMTVNAFSAGIFSTSLIEWLAVARLAETVTEPPWVSRIYLALLALVPAKMLILGRTNRWHGVGWRGGCLFDLALWAAQVWPAVGGTGNAFFGAYRDAESVAFPFYRARAMLFFDILGKLFFYGTLIWLLCDSVRDRPNDSPAARSKCAGSDSFRR